MKYFCWVLTIFPFSVQKPPRMLFYGSPLMHVGSFGIYGWPGSVVHPRLGRYLQRNCLPAPPMIKQTNKNLDWTILLSFDNFSIQCPKVTSNVILLLPSYARGHFWHFWLAWQSSTSSAGSLFAKELPNFKSKILIEVLLLSFDNFSI